MKKKSLIMTAGMFVRAGLAFAHEGHEHVAVKLSSVSWGLKGLQELVNIHPLFVHFPIALLMESTAFYFLGSWFKKEELLKAGKWALYFGTLATAVTVWTGLQAAKTVSHGGDVHPIMMMHQYFGFAVLTLSVLLSAWLFFSKSSLPAKGKVFFLAGLVFLALILTQGADFGGRMVFLHGVGVNKQAAMMDHNSMSHRESEETEQHEHGH